MRIRPARPTTTPCRTLPRTILQECCGRPSTAAFHQPPTTPARHAADHLQLSRRNHSDYMRGRIPHQILTNHPTQLHHDHQPQSPSVDAPVCEPATDTIGEPCG